MGTYGINMVTFVYLYSSCAFLNQYILNKMWLLQNKLKCDGEERENKSFNNH